MSEDVASILSRGREMRRRGQYADAVRCWEPVVHSGRSNLSLIVEMSETLFIQGEYARCDALLRTHLSNWDARSEPDAIAGHMIHYLAHLYKTTAYRENLQHADDAYAWYLSSTYSEVVDEATVRIETYYASFCRLAAMCGSFDDRKVQRELVSRLKVKFPVLLGRCEFRDALAVARVCNVCDTGPSPHELLKTLLDDARVPGTYRAHAHTLLAQSLSEDQREERYRLFLGARELFKAEGHVHGVLDADLAILCGPPSGDYGEDFDKKVLAILKQYDTVEYPSGLASGLRLLADTSHKRSDVIAETAYLNDVEALYTASGARLLWLMVRISVLARMALRGGAHFNTIHAGEALWEEIANSDCTTLRSQIALCLPSSYLATGNREKMVMWQEHAKESLAGSQLIKLPNLDDNYDLSAAEGITEGFQMLSCSIDDKSAEYSAESAAQSYGEFVQAIIRHPTQDPLSHKVIKEVIDTWEQHARRCTEAEGRIIKFAKIHEARSTMLFFQSSTRRDIDLEVAALDHTKEARNLYLKVQELSRALLVLHQEGLLNVSVAQKFERIIQYEQAICAFQDARNCFKATVDWAGQLGLSSIETQNAYWIAFCEYRLWFHGKFEVDDVLESLLTTERFTDRQRQEASIFRGITAVTAKRAISSEKHVRNVYKLALQLCSARKTTREAWDWAQKSKARSLSDALGLGVLVPRELMDRINQNPELKQLLEQENAISEDFQASPQSEHFKIRRKLESLQAKMRVEPVLAELLDLREGVPFSLPELGRKVASGHGTVFVDWLAFDNDISMFVVREAEQPLFFKLPITIRAVREWVSEHLNSVSRADGDSADGQALLGLWEEDDEDGPLRGLDALIAPLHSLTRPDELIVMCPTGVLHSLPLHALQFGPSGDRQLLIERNLVVYCASLTTFVQCCHRAEERPVSSPVKRFLTIYEQSNGDAGKSLALSNDLERHQLYAFAKRQAEELKGEFLVGRQVTPTSMRASLEDADWVQFIGHYNYSHETVAEQTLLVCGDGEANSGSPPGEVAVKDLFDFRMRTLHMTVLGCASAAQDFQVGDEPLGLIAALLAAGVASVVGTLWPVQVATARYFSERFHYHLLDAPPKVQKGQRWHNLARAVREAVLDVRHCWESFRQPYHWASLVLHGAWFYNGELR